ncbi:MAG: heme-binding protein [Pseudomonadota bacterium]
MRRLGTLDLADAEQLADEATRLAEAEAVAIHIAVCDAAGHLILYKKHDRANVISGDIAIAKAFTSAGTGAATGDLTARTLPGEPGWGLQHMASGRLTTLGGGVALRHNDQVIGALGVSGGSVAQDVAIATAAARILET